MTVKVFFCHHENDARYCGELSKHLGLAVGPGFATSARSALAMLCHPEL